MPKVYNIVVAQTGIVWIAPTIAAAPVDANSALDPLFEELGYVTDSGVVLEMGASYSEKSSWTGIHPAGFYIMGQHLSVSCSLLQVNKDVLEFVRDSTTTTNGAQWKVNPASASANLQRSFVLDWVDGAHPYRLYIPVGVVVEAGDSQISRQGAMVLPFKIGAVSEPGIDVYTIFWIPSQRSFTVDAVINKPDFTRPLRGKKQNTNPQPVRGSQIYN